MNAIQSCVRHLLLKPGREDGDGHGFGILTTSNNWHKKYMEDNIYEWANERKEWKKRSWWLGRLTSRLTSPTISKV